MSEITKHYRRLIQKAHTDLGGESDSRAAQINKAYQTLQDFEERQNHIDPSVTTSKSKVKKTTSKAKKKSKQSDTESQSQSESPNLKKLLNKIEKNPHSKKTMELFLQEIDSVVNCAPEVCSLNLHRRCPL